MVRRWSYLNTSYRSVFDVDSTGLSSFIECHSFKVFRKTTLFRKYNRGISRFVRRKNIMRKRKTNNGSLALISATWVMNYLRSRRLSRFFQSEVLLPTAKYISSVEVFIIKAKQFGFQSGAFLSSTPTFLSKGIRYRFNRSSRNSSLQTVSTIDSKDSILSNLITNSYVFERQSFKSMNAALNKPGLSFISKTILDQLLKFSVGTRQILILCTLLNISKV